MTNGWHPKKNEQEAASKTAAKPKEREEAKKTDSRGQRKNPKTEPKKQS